MRAYAVSPEAENRVGYGYTQRAREESEIGISSDEIVWMALRRRDFPEPARTNFKRQQHTSPAEPDVRVYRGLRSEAFNNSDGSICMAPRWFSIPFIIFAPMSITPAYAVSRLLPLNTTTETGDDTFGAELTGCRIRER